MAATHLDKRGNPVDINMSLWAWAERNGYTRIDGTNPIPNPTVEIPEHSHDALQVLGLAEAVRDIIGAALRPGTNVTIDNDDPGDKITINSTGGGAPTQHSHAIADVTNLQAALDALSSALGGKAQQTHTHSAADLNAGTLAVARATPGVTLTIRETSPGVYPTRGTSRTDVTVHWIGTQAPTKGSGYMADNDIWLKAATA